MAIDNNRWGILYCPKTNAFRPQKRWEKIEKYLKEQQVAYDYVQSESASSVQRLIKLFINSGYKTIIVVGGDSALNDTVNCLMQVDAETRNQIVLGLIPNGLMNDFAHFWGIEEDDEERLVKAFKRRRVKKIDMGCIRYTNTEGDACRRYFLNCINIGYVAAIMNLRRKMNHIFGSRALSFLFSFGLLLFQRLDYKMHLKINTDVIKRKVMTVCVGNALGYGQTPNAVPYNGLLDVSIVYHPEMTQLFEGIYLFLRGKFLNHRSVHPYRTKKVEVFAAKRAMVGIDGRLMKTPVDKFTISIAPDVINFLLPD